MLESKRVLVIVELKCIELFSVKTVGYLLGLIPLLVLFRISWRFDIRAYRWFTEL
jgi:hypothetical protein